MAKDNRQPVVCTRVPERVRKTLEALAERKGVKLAEYLRWLLIDHVDRNATKGK